MSKKKGWRSVYGSFLKATDLPKEGQKFVISGVEEKVIGQDKKAKLVATLKGLDKGWVLNTVNCEALEEISGSDDPDDWSGQAVTLFNDRSVRGPNGEKGGIRIKAKSKKAADDDDDDVDADLEELDDDDEAEGDE
jgi:hypothetical protein